MTRKRQGTYRTTSSKNGALPRRSLVVGALALAAVALVAIAVAFRGGQTVGGATEWAILGTPDVHSLAFDPDDPLQLFFGHHKGLLETRDGGRTWEPTALGGVDAMNVSRPSGGFFQVAGHDVYKETTDGGRTWQDVPNDLPGLDLHAFVADPGDPSHAWAFAVGFGLFETSDRGRTWELRQDGGWGPLTAFVEGPRTVLVALGPSGLARSEDAGRTWTRLTSPAGQVASLAASADGSVLYAGTSQGVQRSTDGGATWAATGLRHATLAVAVHPDDPDLVAVVDDGTRFFRSPDGGRSWPGPSSSGPS